MKLNYRKSKDLTFIQSSRLRYGCIVSKIVDLKGNTLHVFDTRREARMSRAKIAQRFGLTTNQTRIIPA